MFSLDGEHLVLHVGLEKICGAAFCLGEQRTGTAPVPTASRKAGNGGAGALPHPHSPAPTPPPAALSAVTAAGQPATSLMFTAGLALQKLNHTDCW